MRAERKDHIDLGADAFDEPPDLGQVRRRIEHAVCGTDDVDAGLLAFLPFARFRIAAFRLPVLRPQPEHGAISTLPLILIDRAGQEAMNV